jgi:hypothetical protein
MHPVILSQLATSVAEENRRRAAEIRAARGELESRRRTLRASGSTPRAARSRSLGRPRAA